MSASALLDMIVRPPAVIPAQAGIHLDLDLDLDLASADALALALALALASSLARSAGEY